MAPSTYSASNSKIEPLSMINQAQGLAIDVKNLCKKFGNKVAVDNVSIAQPAGSVWGFLGPNGSGKTTTIRMLCGLLEPTSGEGSCLGFDVVKQSREIKNLTGYMTQKFSFWEDLTIKENLDFVARLYEMPNRRKIVEKTLIDLGLEKRQHQLAGSLSGGWKQRLALAAVTMHEPKLLLLDEPTASLDTTTTHQVETLINHWYQSTPNATVVWISHEPTQIQRLLAIGTSHWTMANGQLSNDELTIDSKVPASMAQGNQP